MGVDFITFQDTGTNEVYHGISLTGNVGTGIEGHANANYTFTPVHFNYFTVIDDYLSEYINESILNIFE